MFLFKVFKGKRFGYQKIGRFSRDFPESTEKMEESASFRISFSDSSGDPRMVGPKKRDFKNFQFPVSDFDFPYCVFAF